MNNLHIVRSPSTGLARRTYRGKQWGVIVQQDETSTCELLIFKTEAKAQKVCTAIGNLSAPLVHYVEKLKISQ
ncbi:MAG: hypothetical protein LW837_20295 [Roseomonas sp.]|jgi:hypothetical protein|nr:hypothetical protein [Roseomonas sp.]